jgi:hypothetical protein
MRCGNTFIGKDKTGNTIMVPERVRKWILLRQEAESYLLIFKLFSLFWLIISDRWTRNKHILCSAKLQYINATQQ